MNKPDKFLFDTVFPTGTEAESGDIEWDIPSREDYDQAVAESLEQGRIAGRAEAEAETVRREAEAIESCAQGITHLQQSHGQQVAIQQQNATALALAIAKKLAPALIAAQPLAEIEALVTESVSRMLGEPRIVVRVADVLLDSFQRRLDKLTHQLGYGGQVILIGEPSLAPGDCKVEWADGGADRDTAALSAHVDQAVKRIARTPPEPVLTEAEPVPTEASDDGVQAAIPDALSVMPAS